MGKIFEMNTGELRLSEIWEETLSRFKYEARPFIKAMMIERKTTFITAEELMEITEEKINEFLSRDPEAGFWHPEIWAEEVMANFDNSETYYFEKLQRLNAK